MNLKFEFTQPEAQLIINALQELPHKVVNALVNKIQQQATRQLNPQEPPAPVPQPVPVSE